MKKALDAVITESGIWYGEQKKSHGFLLSPSVYEITSAERDELCGLGGALHDCLVGLSQIAVIAYRQDFNAHGGWQLVRRIFSTGVPKVYQELQGIHPTHIPRLLKVDFMVDQNGAFKIAEIDGHNKHGLGYSTLGSRFRNAVQPNMKALPGVVAVLSKEIKRQGYNELKFLYADQERFYKPEFDIAKQEFEKNGIICHVVSEMNVTEDFLTNGLLLDLPFMNHKINLYDTVIPAYKKGDLKFIIPPKPFLGSKGVLALLRNDSQDAQLEAIMNAFVKSDSLDMVRRYIPETYLIGKEAMRFKAAEDVISGKRYVLKEAISSGMKGTHFSDEHNFIETLTKACNTKMNWVLQEEVVSKLNKFSWYEETSSILKTADDWMMRATAHYTNRTLSDIIVTSRRDKSVHGAKDSIQIGTVVV